MPFYPKRYVPAFDGRTDLVAAYSLRLLRRAFTGPLVQIRRSSDNATQDFHAPGGRLDLGGILAFIGGGSGYVSKWYDQSGNGNDLTQGTAGSQPSFGVLGNGLPGMTMNGSTGNLANTSFALAQPCTYHAVLRDIAKVNSQDNLFGTDAHVCFLNSSNVLGIYAGSILATDGTSFPIATRGAVGVAFNGASSDVEINSAAVSSFSGNAGNVGASTKLYVGQSTAGGGQGANEEFQELVIFNTAHSQAQMKADNAAMRAAWRF